MNDSLTLALHSVGRRSLFTAPGRGQTSLLLTVLLCLGGCATHKSSIPEGHYSYVNPNKDLTAIGRVAIVELENDSTYPQISADVTAGLFQALQKRQMFGLTVVSQHDPAWRSLQLEGNSVQTLEQILAIRETLKCDAVLLGTVTGFGPYPHMTMGLRLKLLDLRDGQLLWAIEQVWDSTDKATEKRIKEYYLSEKRSGFAPLKEELAAVSPLEFIKFVSYEVAGTL